MPQPTKEQFETAARNVMRMAPPGLSRDEFFMLVNKELERGHEGEPGTPPNPQTFEKPFTSMQRLEDLGLQAADAAQHPKDFGKDEFGEPYKVSPRVRSFMSSPLVHPTGVNVIDSFTSPASLILGTAAFAKPTARMAGTVLDQPSPRRFIGGKLKDFGNSGSPPAVDIDKLIAEAAGLDRYLPSKSGVESAAPVETQKVPYGDYHAKPALDTGRLSGKAPTLESVLLDAVQGAGKAESPTAVSLPPEIETAGEGALKQSGKFPVKGRPEAGGYSSGRPGVTDTRYDEMVDNKFGGGAGDQLGAAETPRNSASGSEVASTPASPPESLDSVLERMVLEQHNPGAMAQQAQDLRRQVGSRDAARQMFGTANPETQGAIRTMSPGPSQTPTDALERIMGSRKLAAQGVDGMSPEEIQDLIRSIEGSGQ